MQQKRFLQNEYKHGQKGYGLSGILHKKDRGAEFLATLPEEYQDKDDINMVETRHGDIVITHKDCQPYVLKAQTRVWMKIHSH